MATRTALVTGASRGIGREVARTLSSEGWQVIAAVRDPAAAPPGTEAQVVDMSDAASIAALAQRLRARNQLLDALVNNAGIYKGPARAIWAVNVLGPLLLTRALEPLLAPNARVVMVTSGLGASPPSPGVSSSASRIPHCRSPGSSAWPRKRPAGTAGAKPRSMR